MPSFLGHPRLAPVLLPPPLYATWNPAGTNPNITLSNGNLTAELAVFDGNSKSTRTQTGRDSGRYYVEFYINNISVSPNNISIGLIDTNQEVSGDLGDSIYGYAWRLDGVKEQNNIENIYGFSLSSGSTIMMAYKLYSSNGIDMADIYFGANGVWFNGSNPESENDPAYFGVTAPLATDFVVGCTLKASGDRITANFGQSEFVHTVPFGYGHGWGSNIIF